MEDRNLTQKEAMQLVKDFTAEHAHNEVAFYMGMVAVEQQTFEGLVQHLKNAFQSSETTSKLISDFYGNKQLKSQYAHNLKDSYYAAITRSMLQSSEVSESFTQF